MIPIRYRPPLKPPPGMARINSAHPLASGLVGAWIFNEGAGVTVQDIRGVAPGTFTNTPVWKAGIDGVAINFTRGSLQYIDLGAVTTLALSTFTYTAFIRPSDTTGERAIIGSSAAGGPEFRLDGGTSVLRLLKQATASIGASTGAIAAGQGSVVSVSYDSASGAFAFYIDGAPDATGSSAQTFTYGNLWIGGALNSSEYFTGDIVWVLIHDRILSTNEAWVLAKDPYAILIRPEDTRAYSAAAAATAFPWLYYAQHRVA